MGFMNWLMNGVGFSTEEVYDDSVEKQKKREEKQEKQRQLAESKAEYKARKAQEKAERVAKKYELKQAKNVPPAPEKPSKRLFLLPRIQSSTTQHPTIHR